MQNSVLQDWIMDLSLMQQSVLLSSIRGPDGIRKEHPVKVIIRWYRRCILISAFDKKAILDPHVKGGGSFTGPLDSKKDIYDYIDIYFNHFDELPLHFHMHLMHAIEILGYKHPDKKIRSFWNDFYKTAVKYMHLIPETMEQMDYRLGDVKEQWEECDIKSG